MKTSRYITIGLIVLILGLIIGVYYHVQWKQARIEAWRLGENKDNHRQVVEVFYAHLFAGRIDEAYESTTAEFRMRTSRDHFAELAKSFVAYKRARFRTNQGRSESGPQFGSPGTRLQGQRMRVSENAILLPYEDAPPRLGTFVQVGIVTRRDRDSILRLTPPPLKVDDFRVEEKAPPKPTPKPSGTSGTLNHRLQATRATVRSSPPSRYRAAIRPKIFGCVSATPSRRPSRA